MAKHLVQHNTSNGLPSFSKGLKKYQIHELAEQSVNHVLEEGNPFEVAEALAAMEEFVKSVRRDERYNQFLRDELARHHGSLTTGSGAKIELCEAGVRYDYTHSAEWKALDEEIRALQETRKLVEEKLKMVAPGRMAVDPETGEVVEGAFKSSRSTYRITLGK